MLNQKNLTRFTILSEKDTRLAMSKGFVPIMYGADTEGCYNTFCEPRELVFKKNDKPFSDLVLRPTAEQVNKWLIGKKKTLVYVSFIDEKKFGYRIQKSNCRVIVGVDTYENYDNAMLNGIRKAIEDLP